MVARGSDDALPTISHRCFHPQVDSTINLLSSLFVAAEGCFLGSIVVDDAFLQVEQEQPTVVKVDSEYYQLGYTLPGHGAGRAAWHNKSQKIVRLKSKESLAAERKARHHHLQEGLQELAEKLKGKDLKTKVTGPSTQGERSIGFSNSTFSITGGGVELLPVVARRLKSYPEESLLMLQRQVWTTLHTFA